MRHWCQTCCGRFPALNGGANKGILPACAGEDCREGGSFFRARAGGQSDFLSPGVQPWVWLLLLCLIAACLPVRAQTALLTPREITLPSAFPSGHPTVDRIRVRFYPVAGLLTPGVVILPPSGSSAGDPILRRLAEYLNRQGIACAVMDLPYHGQRRLSGMAPAVPFIGSDVATAVHAFRQSASDVGTVADWLQSQPGIDPHRLGVIGISLGAIVAHLAMGENADLRAGVAVLGGGDLPDLYHASALVRFQRFFYPVPLDPKTLPNLRLVDPLTYAAQNQPRHVLMIEAARDLLVPPRDALELWNALGRPPIQWLDTDHFAVALTPEPIFRAAAAYLWSVWNGHPALSGADLPQAYSPTLKFGLLMQSGRPLTPSVQWQFVTLGHRPDHLSLLHADVGLTGRGPFLGLGATVTPFIDAGLSPRLDRHGVRPYVSLHVAL